MGQARIRRRTVRPSQKFFISQDAVSMGKQVITRVRFPGLDIFCDLIEGNYYYNGYLLKDVSKEEMTTAVNAVFSGGTYLGSKVGQNLQAEIKPDIRDLICNCG